MITYTILVCYLMSNVLFDPVSSYSYVCMRFAFKINIICDVLEDPTNVSTHVGHSVIVTHVYCTWPIFFMGYQTWAYFVILDRLTLT